MGKILVEADEALLAEAQKVTGAATKEAAVAEALRALLRKSKPRKLTPLDLAGKIQFSEGYDYKALRADRDFSD